MASRRTYLANIATVSAVSLTGCSGLGGSGDADGQSADVTGEPTTANDSEVTLQPSSDAFDHGGTIPTKYTCDGEDSSPPLSAGWPEQVESWAVIMTDPDAPGGTFTHWLIWNLPPTQSLPEDVPQRETVAALDDAPQGTNDFGDLGYGGPCPPQGDGPHRYVFEMFAIEETLDIDPGVKRAELEGAIEESTVLGRAMLQASYER